MSRTGRFRVSCFLLFGGLLLLAATLLAPTLRAQSDPMAKWKPSVGSSFIYRYSYHHWHTYPNGSYTLLDSLLDTVGMVVNSVNSFYDSAHPSVVTVRDSGGSSNAYWFHVSSDTGISSHPLMIDDLGSPSPVSFDLANSRDSATPFELRNITIWSGTASFGDPTDNGGLSIIEYSPDLRWFFSMSGWQTYHTSMLRSRYVPLDMWDNSSWKKELISAVTVGSGVESRTAPSEGNALVSKDGRMIMIRFSSDVGLKPALHLNDILGRPVRTWAMEVAAGESQITLNVADVPSGIYFLKLSAPGVEEVRRVCIAH